MNGIVFPHLFLLIFQKFHFKKRRQLDPCTNKAMCESMIYEFLIYKALVPLEPVRSTGNHCLFPYKWMPFTKSWNLSKPHFLIPKMDTTVRELSEENIECKNECEALHTVLGKAGKIHCALKAIVLSSIYEFECWPVMMQHGDILYRRLSLR